MINEIDYYKIGQRIRKYRKACGISQEMLAEKVDISTTHLSHIETGNTKLSLIVLVKLASALSVSTDDILSGEIGFSHSSSMDKMAEILDRCTPSEQKIICDIATSLIDALRKHT